MKKPTMKQLLDSKRTNDRSGPEEKASIAIVDDHDISVTGLSEITSEIEGFSVDITANNGKELYEKIAKAVRIPDIVILDISMPVWDGYQTIEAIKAKWPQVKFLVISMHNHEMGIIKMFRSGAGGYLMKNSKPQEIKNALISIYENGHYFNDVASVSMFNKLKVSDTQSFLTAKEVQLLKHCPSGLTYKQIAVKMKTNERNVHAYRVSLFEKFKVNSREELILCALQMGMLFIE